MTELVHRCCVLLLTLLTAASVSGLFLSCADNDNGGISPDYIITIEEMPEALPVGVALYFPIIVRLEPNEPGTDSLLCWISDPEDELYLSFYLHDDGSAYDHPSEGGLFGVRSGDIVPGDGRFSRQITGQNFDDAYGTYAFDFMAPDGSGLQHSMEIGPVEVPFFTEIEPVVDSLPSGFEPIEYEAQIHKPTAIDRIDSVCLEITYSTRPQPILRRISFDPTADDTLWTLTLTSGHLWGIQTGLYDFHFVLWDRFGLSADTSHDYVGFWNGAPSVFNSTLPDTIWRPRQGEPNDTTAVTVQADDPESLLDIAEVRFETRKVWQTEWQSHPDFYLLDLGGEWDEVAGDGIYAVPLVTSPSDSLHNNLFYFRFYAADRTTQRSDYLIDSVWVVERPSAL
jgi:hypothetical protein